MEQETITVMMQAMLKGSEMLFSIGKVMGKGAIKTAAFTKAYWNKATERGHVCMMRLMKRGGPYETIELTQAQLDEFDKICRKANIPYTCMQKGDMAVLMINRQDFIDIAPALEFKHMGISRVAEEKAAVNEVQGEQYAEAQKPAVTEVIAEQDAVMNVADYDNLVAANKDNSLEASMIYSKYWPALKKQGELSYAEINTSDYQMFKEANDKNIAYAVCAKGTDTMLMAYRTNDEEVIADIMKRPINSKPLNDPNRIYLKADENDLKNWKHISNEEIGLGAPAAIDKANEVSSELAAGVLEKAEIPKEISL